MVTIKTDVTITKKNTSQGLYYSAKFLMSGNEYSKNTLGEIMDLAKELNGGADFTYNIIDETKPKPKKMSARFWTAKECKQTLNQCKEAGMEIKSREGFTEIFNGADLVVSWIKGSGRNMVRVDLTYFN